MSSPWLPLHTYKACRADHRGQPAANCNQGACHQDCSVPLLLLGLSHQRWCQGQAVNKLYLLQEVDSSHSCTATLRSCSFDEGTG
jgi:hypothetical protein